MHFYKNNSGKALINLGERLIGFFDISKTQNGIYYIKSRQTWSAKVLGRKGNSPDHKLKTLNKNLVLKERLYLKLFDKLA